MLTTLISPTVPEYTAVSTSPGQLEENVQQEEDRREQAEEFMKANVAVRNAVLPGAHMFGLGAFIFQDSLPRTNSEHTESESSHLPVILEEGLCLNQNTEHAHTEQHQHGGHGVDVGVQVVMDVQA